MASSTGDSSGPDQIERYAMSESTLFSKVKFVGH